MIEVEVCSGEHCWARQFQTHGRAVRPMALKQVAAYRMTDKRGKTELLL